MIKRYAMAMIAMGAVAALGTNAAQAGPSFEFNFAAEAAGNEHGAAMMEFTDTVKVKVTADYNGNPIYAYLDDKSSNRPAGLGACKQISLSAQCVPASDDNVQFGEMLTLAFDQQVKIEDLTMRAAEHYTTFTPGAKIAISVDGGPAQDYLLAHVMSGLNLVGSIFTFTPALFGNQQSDEFYIQVLNGSVVDVPAPGALGLMGLGLAGLGFARRRRA